MGDLNLIKIDGKPTAELGKTLIDKLDKCLGWVASPKGTTPDAIDYYVEEIKNDKTLPPLQKAAMISNARKIIHEYSNQNDILSIAMKQFDGTEKPDQIEEDWISHFFDGAKHVSNEDIQLIWGKILSNECKAPGNTPKKLIHILSLMSTKSAKCFGALCKFVMKYGDLLVPVVIRGHDFFKESGISYYGLLDLADLGLILYSDSGHTMNMSIVKLTYFDKQIEITTSKQCPIGNAIFTEAGECLFQSMMQERAQDEYLEVCTAFWKKNNCEVKITSKNSVQ
ncbi:hypothetical protein OBV_43160 [Oscillibacter valericigenes Sjm18-20]|nr:hypothetical protein OBV_43160 [Oscillibacter valericigenes Sjm18-20]